MQLRKLFWVLLLWPMLVSAHHADKDTRGLRDVTVLIIRHAEKPDQGNGLSPRGEQRAQAYASYFDPFQLDGSALMPQRLIATSDSKASMRPRLTLTPLAARLQLPIEQPWADDQVDDLAKELRKRNEAPVVLIAWHHGHIVKLIEALGGDAKQLLGRKTWPGDVYNWVVVLHFDDRGRLNESASRLVQEHLLLGD
ncbi:flagellar basal body-associated protein FliL [Rhodanobacter sp. C05]|uniref:flagellar basal body-associated protein FliL n=1 Tax=Rhodanobacter sp. C05 TaxID=1945855 RepID=UPI0009873CEE|nr:flagellar basal body-associated protein FliL [Rhodanobacter sp. C05]OOG40255.1 flagellar basal body-associated protein FliL [Rhodanobacter sp. C05]